MQSELKHASDVYCSQELAQAQPIAQHSPPPKRKPDRRSARAKLEGAVQFIQERNEHLDHEQQWAITQSLIGTLTGSNISLTVKPFWYQIESTIAQYNGDRSLDERRQNYGRSHQLPHLKEEFDTWLDAQLHR
ncbi:hypothetical protein IQ268_17065 [Oculatella sp. LEGE 06141]|uniref:hypothetical protein n=1 Tax=Oculatella sp. LEGE 06141 TaxID=1828648 RepID=UPI00187E7CCD|nr:hypothetical protein [Oculatella sp. LEGE 06141]MBE9180274.1 hypothetical protein [Oculatella sp. LEGE 06141]